MTKIVIDEYGGFNLSVLAIDYYATLKGIKIFSYKRIFEETNIDEYKENYRLIDPSENIEYNGMNDIYNFTMYLGDEFTTIQEFDFWFIEDFNIKRNDPFLIKTMEDLGEKINGYYTKLKIVEIPDDVEWVVRNEGGYGEYVSEKCRTWR